MKISPRPPSAIAVFTAWKSDLPPPSSDDDLAIDHSRSAAELPRGLDDRAVVVRPVEPVPREGARLPVDDDEERAIRIEFRSRVSTPRPSVAPGPAKAAWEERRREN